MPLPDRLPEFARLVALANNFSVADPHARTILLADLARLADGLRADLAAELESGTGELAEPIESALARLEALAAPLDRRSGPRWEKSDRWARIGCGKALAALLEDVEAELSAPAAGGAAESEAGAEAESEVAVEAEA